MEQLFDFFQKEVVVVVGEFAGGRELLELAFALAGGGVVFLEGEGFAGEAGEGVDEAREALGLGLGVGRGGGLGEASELVEHLGGGNAEAGFVEVDGVRGGEDVGGEIGFGGEPFQPLALLEELLVVAFMPLMEVARVEVFAGIAEALDDLGVGKAVEQHVIELVADGFGEASDFAVAAMGEGGG